MGGTCGTRGGERRCIRGDGLVWTLEGKGPFARHSRRWENNNKMNLTALRYEGKNGFIWLRKKKRQIAGCCWHVEKKTEFRKIVRTVSELLEGRFACPEGLCSMSLTVRHLPPHSSTQ